MAPAELAQRFPLISRRPAPLHPLLALLAGFQQALDTQFDACRHDAAALPRLRAGLELLCRLQETVLHPALCASRPAAWPDLGRAMAGVQALRDLAVLSQCVDTGGQPAIAALLEGVAQLQFASLDELLAEADASAMPWGELECLALALLVGWQASDRATLNC